MKQIYRTINAHGYVHLSEKGIEFDIALVTPINTYTHTFTDISNWIVKFISVFTCIWWWHISPQLYGTTGISLLTVNQATLAFGISTSSASMFPYNYLASNHWNVISVYFHVHLYLCVPIPRIRNRYRPKRDACT